MHGILLKLQILLQNEYSTLYNVVSCYHILLFSFRATTRLYLQAMLSLNLAWVEHFPTWSGICLCSLFDQGQLKFSHLGTNNG